MARFFTSDLHFGHRNVIPYCNRPYADILDMEAKMTEMWNNQVKSDDEVYVIGDVSLNPKAALLIGPRLNGKKLLVPGNHDACYPFPNRNQDKIGKVRAKYEKAGWKVLDSKVDLVLSNGQKVLLCHFPYGTEDAKKFDQRYWQERPKDEGLYLLQGHLHAKYLKNGRCIDIGWDGKLDLYSEQDIIDLINDERDYIPSRITDYYATREVKASDEGGNY